MVAEEFRKGRVNHKELVRLAKEKKLQMNDRRKEFTWDHLQEFYMLED